MQLWWTWARLKHIVAYVRENGVTTPAEWKRLKDICSTVPESKRAYLYREFSPMFSPGSLYYLFGDYRYNGPLPERVTA